jgi:hypothetical protein
MRIPEDQIRAALLDPEEEVRCTALCWYSEAFSRDSTLMPVVLDSIGRYGPAASWRVMREAQWLVQTPETVDGLIAALDRADDPSDVRKENFRFAAGLALCRAPVELVEERLAVISRCPAFPEVLANPLEGRVLLKSADWDEALAALVRLGEKSYRYRRWTRIDILRADSIIDVLAGFRESRGQGVLALLERRKNQKLVAWLEPCLIRLAGKMGLAAAIPCLLQRLEGDGIRRCDDLALALVTTLARLETEEVLDSLSATWSPAHRRATDADRLRLFACDVMERMRSDRCIEFLMDHISDNADRPLVRISTAHALLAQFERRAVAPVRRLIRETKVAGYTVRLDLYYHLLAACRVMQESFPGFDRRYERAVAANWGRGARFRDWPMSISTAAHGRLSRHSRF